MRTEERKTKETGKKDDHQVEKKSTSENVKRKENMKTEDAKKKGKEE